MAWMNKSSKKNELELFGANGVPSRTVTSRSSSNCWPGEVTTVWSLENPGGRAEIVATSRVNVGAPALSPGVVGISTEAPSFHFRLPDPPGTYVIRARTTDHVANITLQTRADISVTQ